MKRIIKVICIVFAVVVAAFSLVACADAGAPSHDVSQPKYSVTTSALEQKLSDFLGACKNRTTYSDAERRAAEYLNEQLLNYGYNNTSIKSFAVKETITVAQGREQEREMTSQNVVAVYSSDGSAATRKNVILGAYYDNLYDVPYQGASGGYGVSAALSNGTGVATLLEIAQYLQNNKPALDFDVTIVFFGASAMSTAGAQRFYNDMTSAERAATVLMVELQRVGAKHIYAYSDSRKTQRESFFDGIAADNGLDIYKATQKSPLITGLNSLNGIPYYQWVHSGVFSPFFNADIPTLNIIGGDWESMNLTDGDSVSFTESDTLKTLKRNVPDYSEKMATAATLVIKSLEDGKFLSVMQYDRDNFPNTDILNKEWIWYLIVLSVLFAAAIAMYFVLRRLEKKYPITVPQPKQMKMAVFGMDYEDKNSDNIYIDIKSVNTNEEIFPGVANNDASPKTPFDDIFQPFAPFSVKPRVEPSESEQDTARSQPMENGEGEHLDPVSQNERDKNAESETNNAAEEDNAVAVDKAPEVKKSEKHSRTETEDTQSADIKSEKSSVDKSNVKPAAEKKTPATRKAAPQTKRKTVSAGKSTHKSDTADNNGEEKEKKDTDKE